MQQHQPSAGITQSNGFLVTGLSLSSITMMSKLTFTKGNAHLKKKVTFKTKNIQWEINFLDEKRKSIIGKICILIRRKVWADVNSGISKLSWKITVSKYCEEVDLLD